MIKQCEVEGWLELDIDEPLMAGDTLVPKSTRDIAIHLADGGGRRIYHYSEVTDQSSGETAKVVGKSARYLWMEMTRQHAKEIMNWRIFRQKKIFHVSIHSTPLPLP